MTCASAASAAAQDSTELIIRARVIHDRVLTLDTHVDIDPADFTRERSYATKLASQVSLPAMEEGGLDAAFFVVFVSQSADFSPAGFAKAHRQAMDKFAAIRRLTGELAPTRIGFAGTAADVRRIYASGKKVALIGVENGYSLGTDPATVRTFAESGARYLSLAHNGHNQLSDSHTGEKDGHWRYHGLSPLGKQVVAELNRWGVMVDVSHASRESMMQTAALSRAPIIASHSGVRARCNHSRNLDDDQLRAVKATNGVVQVVAFSGYLICHRAPHEKATVADLIDHIDYAVQLIGIDHVGIASDFDGGGGVVGWNNASETFNVTLELVRRGYSEEQIAKLWSGNLLRVMADVETVGAGLRGDAK